MLPHPTPVDYTAPFSPPPLFDVWGRPCTPLFIFPQRTAQPSSVAGSLPAPPPPQFSCAPLVRQVCHHHWNPPSTSPSLLIHSVGTAIDKAGHCVIKANRPMPQHMQQEHSLQANASKGPMLHKRVPCCPSVAIRGTAGIYIPACLRY